MSQTPKSPDDPRYGWVMVAVAFLLFGMGNGSLNLLSVFLVPLGEQFGWSRSETSLGFTLGTLAFGLGGIAMGWLADRYSLRVVAIVGTTSMGLSLVLMGSQSELWQFYLLYILMGGLGYSALWSPLLANLGNWFARNRGLAVGIATAGQMLGTGIVPFFARHLISSVGWRSAYSTLGYIFLGALLPLSLLVRRPREIAAQSRASGSGISQDAEQGLHPRPWLVLCWLSLAAFLDRAVAGTIMIHIVALLQDKGVPPQTAASVLLVFYVGAFLCRPGFGRLADKIGGLKSWMIAITGLGTLVFWLTQADALGTFYLLAALLGLFNASATTAIISVQELLPAGMRAVSIAILSLCGFGGTGVGGWQGGIFFDLNGSYTQSFANAAFAAMASLTLLGLLYFYLRRHNTALVANSQKAAG